MEDNHQVVLTPEDQEKTKTNKGVVILLVIIVLVLSATVGILFSKLGDKKEEVQKAADIQEILESQKNRLEEDLTDLQYQFGSLQTNNDSLRILASEQQEKISKLLSIQADNTYKIKTYQKELETLRGVLKSLIVQVDSLNTRNLALKAENTELTRHLAQERAQSSRLTEDKEKLTTTVQKAQILAASDVVTIGLNNRSKETDRVRNIDKLKTCFTIRENSIATAGERTIFLVIIKPDKKVLPNKTNDTFPTKEGGEIVYTTKRIIEYENMDIEPCIYSDNEGRLTAGNYEALLYCDGYMVGSSTFVLR